MRRDSATITVHTSPPWHLVRASIAFEGIFIGGHFVMATSYPQQWNSAMRSYTLVEINTDDTESDIATESAHTEVEALMVFSKEIGHDLEVCDFSDRAEFYLKWLSGGAYERMPVRSK